LGEQTMASKEHAQNGLAAGGQSAVVPSLIGAAGSGLCASEEVKRVLDLCLECRACKVECPVGVDVARMKSEFLSSYWQAHGTPLRTRVLGHVHDLARWGSTLAPMSNWLAASAPVRFVNEKLIGIDRRRRLPAFSKRTFSSRYSGLQSSGADVFIFGDTFTNFYNPEIGVAAVELLQSAGLSIGIAPRGCCGRPLISQGLLGKARELAGKTTEALYPLAQAGKPILFLEPSCLSAIREDAPSLLRGEAKDKALKVSESSFLFEDWLERQIADGKVKLPIGAGPKTILLHGHCHQKAMGLVSTAKSLLSRIPGASVTDLDAGCCGMAGSFGYGREHFEISQKIGERRLLPAARKLGPGEVLIAGGTSCRHQVDDFTGVKALHPAQILRSLLVNQA